MTYSFNVTVETDDQNIDAPSPEQIANEIHSTLDYEAHLVGITAITVTPEGRFDEGEWPVCGN